MRLKSPIPAAKVHCMKQKKIDFTTALLVLAFLVGLSLLLYPAAANAWNSYQAGKQGDYYREKTASLSDEEYQRMWQEALDYNQQLAGLSSRFDLNEEQQRIYESVLDVNDAGMMGLVGIPSIDVRIPVYHGTSESVLQKNAGHIEGTSLPVGGLGTHCVLSGHRGLPSAKLFSDLVNLEEGDYFMIFVLEETLTYQVDQISIIEPTDYSHFDLDPDQDYVTLMTCTPYGINTHRLLVRGHRVDNLPDDYLDTRNEGKLVSRNTVALFIALPVLIIMLVWIMVKYRK